MLKSHRKPTLTLTPPTHDAVFVEYYDMLHRWALQFTEHDRELAEDLLHDAFIHFTLTRPDLNSIENLEGYLYVVMRNLHLSQLRKATRTPLRAMSVVEFDSVDIGFWASDPRDRLRMHDELAAVCQYACIRKESSKGGSVLILRFFHGYYPEEIAHVLRSTRAVVHERLRLARAEARTYLDDPNKLSFIGDSPLKAVKLKTAELGADLRLELQKQIFESRRGDHTTSDTLKETYESENGEGPECRPLAHIVSCQTCLENVNALLGLPPLASRYPLDTIGKDPGPEDRSGGGGGGIGGGAGGPKMLDTFINRRNAHYHHEPEELCISVNGQLQGFQKVVSGKGELTLILDELDTVGFVEVFSEQGLRLLMLNVEPPPVGDGKQAAHVELSSGRTVEANLNFSGPHPALQVSYNDPGLAEAAAIETTTAPDATLASQTALPSFEREPQRSLFDGFRSLLQPARLTAALAVVMIAVLIILKFAPFGTVSAAELLQRSADAEEARLANKDRVLHRTLDLEELNSDGQITARKKIDIWQSAERGITARRLYDEQGRLTAGDWRRADGIQTIYHRGQAAKLQPLPENRVKNITFEDAWQLSASAKEFMAMLDRLEQAQVETRANEYFVNYAPQVNDSQTGIIKASITLSREDLHATAETFTLLSQGETREYRLTEAGYDWRPTNTVAPAVFEPNVELTGVGGPGTSRLPTNTETPGEPATDETANANTETQPTANMATAALEVEVVEALNNAGAFMGEQVGVTRTQDGKILVTALVETADLKKALLAALANVKSNPAVRIKIDTVAEVQARAKPRAGRPGETVQPGTVEQVEVTEGMSPVYAELRKRFSDDEARRFADTVLNRSKQARLHALAAKQLTDRFSPADLQTLSAAERARWLALIRGHADAFIRETESLQRELQQFFPEAGVGASGGGPIGSDTELQSRTRELYEASLAIDRGLGRSFALTAGQSDAAPVKSSQFWRQFADAVRLAKSLASAK
jgi:RNA polymerase sigma factor (sigma-70 family)